MDRATTVNLKWSHKNVRLNQNGIIIFSPKASSHAMHDLSMNNSVTSSNGKFELFDTQGLSRSSSNQTALFQWSLYGSVPVPRLSHRQPSNIHIPWLREADWTVTNAPFRTHHKIIITMQRRIKFLNWISTRPNSLWYLMPWCPANSQLSYRTFSICLIYTTVTKQL